MGVPDYQTIMLPLLKLAGDGKEHRLREVIDRLAGEFRLSDEERKVLVPSGRQEIFDNRVGWARTYMKKAGLFELTGGGRFRITERGMELLRENPPKITVRMLYRYPEFREFKSYKLEDKGIRRVGKEVERGTPEDELGDAYQRITNELGKDLLEELKAVSPSRFEHIVVHEVGHMLVGAWHSDNIKSVMYPFVFNKYKNKNIIKSQEVRLVKIRVTY